MKVNLKMYSNGLMITHSNFLLETEKAAKLVSCGLIHFILTNFHQKRDKNIYLQLDNNMLFLHAH
jgi:hypothetical protein